MLQHGICAELGGGQGGDGVLRPEPRVAEEEVRFQVPSEGKSTFRQLQSRHVDLLADERPDKIPRRGHSVGSTTNCTTEEAYHTFQRKGPTRGVEPSSTTSRYYLKGTHPLHSTRMGSISRTVVSRVLRALRAPRQGSIKSTLPPMGIHRSACTLL